MNVRIPDINVVPSLKIWSAKKTNLYKIAQRKQELSGEKMYYHYE